MDAKIDVEDEYGVPRTDKPEGTLIFLTNFEFL